MMNDPESRIMELLVNAGATRSQALTARQRAQEGDFSGADRAMEDSRHYV